jgi:hypothetical protein
MAINWEAVVLQYVARYAAIIGQAERIKAFAQALALDKKLSDPFAEPEKPGDGEQIGETPETNPEP